MRRFLDGLYVASGVGAAIAILLIFLLVGFQIGARLVDTAMRFAGLRPFGLSIRSLAEICGSLLGTASFLALSYTLVKGGHIRINLVVDRLGVSVRRVVETLIGLLAAGVSLFATTSLARLAWRSYSFGDVSYGTIPIPLALPQGLMTIGLAVLTVAIIDVTWTTWRRGSALPGEREV
jgi:TRAP-type C4-dicarboxylate transport system permease small subunit